MSNYDPLLLDFLKKSSLFSGLSDKQLAKILPLAHEVCFATKQYIICEDECSTHVYLLKEGEVEVVKKNSETNQIFRLAKLTPDAVIGEMSLINDIPHNASVRALEPVVVIAFSISELRALSLDQPQYSKLIARLVKVISKLKTSTVKSPIYPTLVSNLAKSLSQRMHNANDVLADTLQKELEQTKIRAATGTFIVNLVALLSFYVLVEDTANHLKARLLSSSFVTVPLVTIFTIALLFMIKRSGYPLSFYGLTLRNWQTSVRESLLWTIPILFLVVIYKWLLIVFDPDFSGRVIFDLHPEVNYVHLPYWIVVTLMILYVVFAPLQELVARGALQGSLQEFLVGPYKTIWAIVLANLLFSVTHVHISFGVGLVVYVPGLFWGWLYARHRTLIGVSLSHQIVGIWSLFIVGIV